MLTDPWFYAVAIPAVMILGLAKGGFAGVGVLGVPLMALAVSPVQAAAIALPILILQDAVSVAAFRRDWDGRVLAWMLPGAAAGVATGFVLAASVSSAAVEFAVGVTAIVFAAWQLWGFRLADERVVGPLSWPAVVVGAASGFTGQIAHAGGPPFQMYVLRRRLPRDVFIGTSAIFFAVVNWMKVPAYAALGQFTRENLLTSAALVPVALGSTLAGVWLVRRIATERFYLLVYVLLVAVGAKLAWDGARGL